MVGGVQKRLAVLSVCKAIPRWETIVSIQERVIVESVARHQLVGIVRDRRDEGNHGPLRGVNKKYMHVQVPTPLPRQVFWLTWPLLCDTRVQAKIRCIWVDVANKLSLW